MEYATPEQILAPLNEQQRIAAAQLEGPLLVLAGPGSGKTRVFTHRIANMIAQGIDSRSIVALTFTNKAAEEMKKLTFPEVSSGMDTEINYPFNFNPK